MSRKIRGIGVLRFPNRDVGGRSARAMAQAMAEAITVGGILCLPNTRDANGEYEWDFRVEPATEDQIEIRRCDDPTPSFSAGSGSLEDDK